MKNAMIYKDYATRVAFDPHDRVFFGRLAGIRDIVTFHGRTVEELEAAFKEAVDHYLDSCAKLGDGPVECYIKPEYGARGDQSAQSKREGHPGRSSKEHPNLYRSMRGQDFVTVTSSLGATLACEPND
jgi:predicted HicB family RNase H-like nuclease